MQISDYPLDGILLQHTLQIIISNEFHFLRNVFSQPPANVIDVGGNCGLASLFFSTLWPDARVIMVEPSPSNAAIARLNTFMCPHVIIENAAIWGDVGYATMSNISIVKTANDVQKKVEWGLTFEELPSAAGLHINNVVPRIR